MRIGVLGTGMVGRALAGKLRELGHDLVVGSRVAGDDAQPFAEAAAHGELIVNATNGAYALDALAQAGAENLRGKILVDVTNPLDFSRGRPPTLSVCNDDSLAEQIQRANPEARVVKTLNTVNANVMVEPSLVPGEHNLFVSGDDADAKAEVVDLLESFGWQRDLILDLGDITTARGPEMYLPLWLRLFGAVGAPNFNIHVVRG
jgi:8-hydroxy-5-deazaflavin:NADPH oxidoreductase